MKDDLSTWFLLIFAADVASVIITVVVGKLFMYFINRGKPECELCHKVRVTRKTKDKKYWSCRSCRTAYYKENGL